MASNVNCVTWRGAKGESGEAAIRESTSLHEIMIPPAVKAIKKGSFFSRTQLTIENLGEGLEEIGGHAFQDAHRHRR